MAGKWRKKSLQWEKKHIVILTFFLLLSCYYILSDFNPQICSSVDTCKLKSKTKKNHGRQRRKVKQRPDAKARAVTVEKKTENLNPDISWISSSTASLPGSKRLQPLQPKGTKFKKTLTASSSSLDSGTLQRPTIPTSPKHCSLTAPSSARLPGKHHVNPSFLSVSSLPHQECSISNRSGHPSLPTDHQLSSSAIPQFCSTSLSPSYF